MPHNDRTNIGQTKAPNLPSHSSAANAMFMAQNNAATNKETTFILNFVDIDLFVIKSKHSNYAPTKDGDESMLQLWCIVVACCTRK